ncbi:fimbrial tip adhesin FimD [Phocaeicola sp.]
MKKYISYLIGALSMVITLAACTDENAEVTVISGEEGYVTLQLNNNTLTSRAVEAGEDELNENKIGSVDCFFYPNGKTGDPAVFTATGLSANTDNTATLSIKIPTAKITELFGSGSTCRAYVIVNRPTASPLGNETSMPALKKTAIEAEGFTSLGQNGGVQASFVMDGDADITLSADGKSVTGEIPLYRAASKISLFITSVKESITDDAGNTWVSAPNSMKVFFHNGVKKTHIDVSTDGCEYTVQPEDYFEFPLNGETRGFSSVTAEDNSVAYYKHTPFYSYSSDWSKDAEHEAYLTLVVPWSKGGNQYQPCYYQVPINVADKQFLRNNYYKIKLSVGILGSFDPEKPLVLEPSYIILDWGNGNVSADVKNYRYLVVDKNYVVMNNRDEIEVGYLTSHPITTEIATITKPNYSNVNETTDRIVAPFTGFSFNAENNNSTGKNILKLSHLLENDNSKAVYDYVPYTITVKVYHTDNPSISENIVYVQYPALYIKAEKNTATNKWGDVYVNKNQSTTGDWTVVNGIGGTTSTNPNMYVISISALKDANYIIADPRSTTPLSPLGFTPKTDNNRNTLTHYYATQEGGTFESYISPKFRICSAYGRLGSVSLTKENARNRCASYQEAGYPAGRWRVPTSAELKFIGKLCAEKKIPSLFTSGNTYWSASKGYSYNYNNGTFTETTSANYVRCVYDEWYWTDTVNKGTFTWGDKER